MNVINIQYKHLWCWDLMMHSSDSWRHDQQERAKRENAPPDAVYKSAHDGWVSFSSVSNQATRLLIARHMQSIFGESP